MPEVEQRYSTTIAAPVDLCYATIADFEAYPRWSSPITGTTVRQRDTAGTALEVEFVLDMTVRTVRYVLAYTWLPPDRLTWAFVEGDLADIQGSYAFQARDARTTEATCAQAISLGFWLPALLRRPLEQNALRQSVEEFKTEVERRARAADVLA